MAAAPGEYPADVTAMVPHCRMCGLDPGMPQAEWPDESHHAPTVGHLWGLAVKNPLYGNH